MTAESKEYVCCCFITGIADSNPAEFMDVRLLCLLFVVCRLGSGLCDELITR